jgi:predicted lipoprotein with Yx(FWY)xxD motif
MRARLVILLVAAAVVAGATAGSTTAGPEGPRNVVTAKQSRFGRILFDGRGFVLYGFTRDANGRSMCSGACAKAWPPYIVGAKPRSTAGLSGARLGTFKRADGRLQATFAGRPLYYYIGDRNPGQILCQNVREFGGFWRVVRPGGSLVG